VDDEPRAVFEDDHPPADIAPPAPPHPDPESRRVDRLEEDLAALRTELAELRAVVSTLRDELGA
jgi:hypothetical protein